MTPRSPDAVGARPLMAAAARRIMLNVPIRLTRMTRSKASSGIGPSRPTMRPAVPMPAQLTRMRAGPWTSAAAAMAALGARRIGHVAIGEDATDLGGHPLAGIAIAVKHGHACAALGEQPRTRRTEARRAAGDQRCFSGDVHPTFLARFNDRAGRLSRPSSPSARPTQRQMLANGPLRRIHREEKEYARIDR